MATNEQCLLAMLARLFQAVGDELTAFCFIGVIPFRGVLPFETAGVGFNAGYKPDPLVRRLILRELA